jgi:DNA-binding winged helix-turn-helix (wHTH) protein/Tfp pilus assembly protein PilF
MASQAGSGGGWVTARSPLLRAGKPFRAPEILKRRRSLADIAPKRGLGDSRGAKGLWRQAMEAPSFGSDSLRFEGFTLDLARAALFDAEGRAVSLRPKSFDVLVHLVRHAGRVVGREELLDAVWPDVTVTEESVTQCMREVRAALGEAARLLRTVPKRGYLLDAVVGPVVPATAAPEPGGRALAERLMAEARQLLRQDDHSPASWLAQRDLFRRAAAADPGWAAPWSALALGHARMLGTGHSLNRAAEQRAAEEAVERALALAPDDTDSYAALGNVLRQDPDRIEEAEAAFARAVALSPRAHPSRANRGWMLVLLGRAEEGETLIAASLAAAPDHLFRSTWQFYLGMVDLLLARGDHGAARLGAVVGHHAAGLGIEHAALMFAAALAGTGKVAEARVFVAEMRQRDPGLTQARLMATPLWPTRSPVFLAQQARIVAALGEAGLPGG